MKTALFLISFIAAQTATAANCTDILLDSLKQNPNVRMTRVLAAYPCGPSACAVVYENDSRPYPNLNILAFLDLKNQLKVSWSPLNDGKASGHENMQGKNVTYLSANRVTPNRAEVVVSVETPRDALFWPPHRVYFQESLVCGN